MVREQERISLAQIMTTILLVLAGVLLFFFHLGKTGFTRDTPARIAVYARQMNQDGQWLLPVLRGEPRIDVPPLYLWATRLFSGFAPSVTPLQERFAGAACAMLLVLLAAWWLYRHAQRYGREDMAEVTAEGFALLGGLILACNPVFFSKGREGTLNTMFILFYAAAAFCWSESLEARRSFYAGRSWRSWVLWGYAVAGLAMLVRGPLVLPLLIVPYLLAARSYHLRRLDRVHPLGLLLALVIGGSWPLLISIFHPGLAHSVWSEWFSLRMGNLDASSTPFYEFLWHVLASSFPWNLLALVMAWRVVRRKDRSPTLVFWMSSLLGNLLVLTFLSNSVGQHRLPVIFFITLMAADAIYRWNFENAWAQAWRVLLRVLLVLGIILAVVGALLLKSVLGLLLISLVPLAWIAWAVRSRLAGMQYTPWETNLRLSAMVVCVLIAAEAVYLSDYEPKRLFFDEDLAYISRIKNRTGDSDAQVYLQNSRMDILYDYILGTPPVLAQPVSAPRSVAEPSYLVANENIESLVRDPNLDPVTCLWAKDHTRLQEGLLRVVGPATTTTTSSSSSTSPTLSLRQPQRLALLGNQGTRSKAQLAVSKRLAKFVDKQPLDEVLLLGNNLFGPSATRHLDFVDSFEKPYFQLLKRGVTFHAALGREDQSYAWIEGKYPPFNMNKRRYYSMGACAGLVEVFLLDGERLYQDKKFDETQLKWLEDALARSRAPWKVVGLSVALASAARDADVSEELAARLLPLFDRARVAVVAWAGGSWYERLALPGHAPVFLNAGWSGKKPDTVFKPDPRLKLGYGERPGFVILEFEESGAKLRAIDDTGAVIDVAPIPLPGK